jgi:hypothetical protein
LAFAAALRGPVGNTAAPVDTPPRACRVAPLVWPIRLAYEKIGRRSRPLNGVISTLAMIA